MSRRGWRSTRLRVAVGLAIVMLAFVRVTVTGPRVHVRWDAELPAAERAARERQYSLDNGEPVDGAADTWRYELGTLSRDTLGALVNDPAVADLAYLDRDTLATEGRDVQISIRYPFSDLFDRPAGLLRLHRSVWLLLAAAALLAGSGAPSVGLRQRLGVSTLIVVGIIAVVLPFDPSFVTMGGSADHVTSRAAFEEWFGGRVRFEKHLAQVTLLQIYERLGPTAAAPERALLTVSRLGTAWFVICALAIGFHESWSAVVLRYLGLALLAPATLLYFGWRELGYLSLNLAAFPLLLKGLRGARGRLEAASALSGLGAALHGSGLVGLAGAWLVSAGTAGRPRSGGPSASAEATADHRSFWRRGSGPREIREQLERALRVTAWGTAAYLGWIALYVVVLKLSISPDPGPAEFSSWRPLWADDVRLGRVAAAIFSLTGARDLLMSGWIVGLPLLPVALSLWRRYPLEVRAALWYLPPSVLFVLFRWPFEGIGGGMDLVVAGFPALYALAWVCAQDAKRAHIAAALLASAHYAFWRVVLDDRFVP